MPRGGVRDPGAWGLGGGGRGWPPPPSPGGPPAAAWPEPGAWVPGGTRDAEGRQAVGVRGVSLPGSANVEVAQPPSEISVYVCVFRLEFFIVLSPKFWKGSSFVLLLE